MIFGSESCFFVICKHLIKSVEFFLQLSILNSWRSSMTNEDTSSSSSEGKRSEEKMTSSFRCAVNDLDFLEKNINTSPNDLTDDTIKFPQHISTLPLNNQLAVMFQRILRSPNVQLFSFVNK